MAEKAMRRILVDQARGKSRPKHGTNRTGNEWTWTKRSGGRVTQITASSPAISAVTDYYGQPLTVTFKHVGAPAARAFL